MKSIRTAVLTAATMATVAGYAPAAGAQSAATPAAESRHDGQHDFDFEIGSWKIHLKRLVHPLTGSQEWVEYDGTSVTRPVWNGHANLEEFETDGSDGHVEGLTLRTYDPIAHQWNLYWANSRDGNLGIPTTGSFLPDGRGEFYDFERIDGRYLWVRYEWSRITTRSAHFEQAFSIDGGRTWEVNWITDQTRVD